MAQQNRGFIKTNRMRRSTGFKMAGRGGAKARRPPPVNPYVPRPFLTCRDGRSDPPRAGCLSPDAPLWIPSMTSVKLPSVRPYSIGPTDTCIVISGSVSTFTLHDFRYFSRSACTRAYVSASGEPLISFGRKCIWKTLITRRVASSRTPVCGISV